MSNNPQSLFLVWSFSPHESQFYTKCLNSGTSSFDGRESVIVTAEGMKRELVFETWAEEFGSWT